MKSLLLKILRSVLIGKKKWILICQNTRSILWYVEKKVFFGDKNSDLCCDDKKKKKRFLMTEKLDLFLLLKKNEKDFFKKRVSLTI